jgi:hypothetical protein
VGRGGDVPKTGMSDVKDPGMIRGRRDGNRDGGEGDMRGSPCLEYGRSG